MTLDSEIPCHWSEPSELQSRQVEPFRRNRSQEWWPTPDVTIRARNSAHKIAQSRWHVAFSPRDSDARCLYWQWNVRTPTSTTRLRWLLRLVLNCWKLLERNGATFCKLKHSTFSILGKFGVLIVSIPNRRTVECVGLSICMQFPSRCL